MPSRRNAPEFDCSLPHANVPHAHAGAKAGACTGSGVGDPAMPNTSARAISLRQTFRRRWSIRSRWSGPGRPQPRQKHLRLRGVGWEFVHVCIDDASRVAFSQILPDEKKESAVAFLRATVAYYASLSVTITRVMTDNGSCYQLQAPSAAPAAISASSTSGPSLIRPRQTARPSASSRPPCANGPTLRPTQPRTTAPLSCRSGCTDTTGTGRTAV